ncbi:MAG: DUF6967 family protein [Marinibacterium sp.]
MSERLTTLYEVELPYRRKAALKRAEFDSGMSMVRLIIREGTRITQVDLDAETATGLADAMAAAAKNL